MVAVDVVCVHGPRGYFTTQFLVQFGNGMDTSVQEKSKRSSQEPKWVELFCNGEICSNISAIIGDDDIIYFHENGEYSSQPSQTIMQFLSLKTGRNKCGCRHISSNTFMLFTIWLYSHDQQLMVMDIDGTITKSDVRGYLETVYMNKYTYIHDGLIPLLNAITENSPCKIIFLTSRPITHTIETRKLLAGAKEGSLTLPPGPLFTNKEATMQAAYNEIIARNAVVYKSGVLLSVVQLFEWAGRARESGCPFVLGIGNKATDAQAYDLAGIDMRRILLVNKSSRLMVWRGPSVRPSSTATAPSATVKFPSYRDSQLFDYILSHLQEHSEMSSGMTASDSTADIDNDGNGAAVKADSLRGLSNANHVTETSMPNRTIANKSVTSEYDDSDDQFEEEPVFSSVKPYP